MALTTVVDRNARLVTAVIFNPTARGEKATAFLAQLTAAAAGSRGAGRNSNGAVVLKPTRGPGDATHLAREAVAEGVTTVVAAGGDGTVNEVVNGIALVPEGPSRTRLGVLPLGTVNVFAKELGIPTDFASSWRTLAEGRELVLDLGTADSRPLTNGDPSTSADTQRRWFIQMAGAGLDSLSLSRVSWALKKKVGPLAYVWAGMQTLFGPLPFIEAEVDGRRTQGQIAMIGNGRFYGGRWVVFPHAHSNDGLLDLAVVQRISPIRFPFQFAALARGRFGSARDVVHWQGRSVTLRPARPNDQVPFHVEGDNVGQLSATFALDPRRIRVIVPQASISAGAARLERR